MLYKSLLRPYFFRYSPEEAHHLAFDLLNSAGKIPGLGWFLKKYYCFSHSKLEREVFGLKFKNPVGLAAGLDKDAKMIDSFASLGFGFIEIGTLTPKPQPGNDKPRLFRLKQDNAIINRMGFNNEGVDAAVERLKKRKSKIIVGGNIGKNKLTDNADALKDYEICFEKLFPYVDYFVINVSSPNTPGLRELQEKEPLLELVGGVQKKNAEKPSPKPVLLKIAPDLTDGQLDDIIEIVKTTKIAGVIATNTTVSREGLQEDAEVIEEIGKGGLSGKPLTQRSTEVIRYLHQKSGGAFPIVGVGGIHTPEDAIEKLKAGASLVQIYTGLIYEGPELVKRINKALVSE